MAQFREDHELGAGNAAGEELGVARIHHGVGGTLQLQQLQAQVADLGEQAAPGQQAGGQPGDGWPDRGPATPGAVHGACRYER